jgi:diguanylate cyclase (GGDEF)-like protein
MLRIVDFCDRLITSPKFRRPLRCAALFSLLLFCPFTTSEVRAQYRFDHYTTSNGLPQNTVSAITQTRDGYLWFATYDGLVRYDGVNFTIFDKGNAAGLGSHQFLALCEDSRGTLWAGTSDGGLIRYRDGAFNSFTTEHGLPENYVGRIQRTETDRLLIFAGDGFRNYLRWTQGNSLIAANIFLCNEDVSLAAVEPRPLTEYVDRSNRRWVLEPGKLIRFKGDQQTVFPVRLTPDEFLRFRYEDHAGNLWFGTNENEVYQITGDSLKHYLQVDGLPSFTRIKIAGEDSEGNLWFFSERRVMRYRNGQFTLLTEKDGFVSNSVRAVFCDREGVIWVGTNGQGLYRLTRQFLTAYSERDGLLNNIVYPIYEDRAGNIWTGSGDGMTRFTDGRFTAYPLASATKEEPSKAFIASLAEKRPRITARSLCEDHQGRLWIGTGNGLLAFKDGRVTDHSKIGNKLSVEAIFQDQAGNLWVGTEKGLFKERAGATTVYTTKEGLPNDQVTIIYEDKQGNLWVGTRGGLARLEGDRFVSFTTKDGLSGDRIRSLYEDQDGALWIGTFDSGLSRFRAGQFTNYTTRTGLFNNGVFQILEDQHSNFWISSNRGIYRVSRKQLNDYADGKVAVINCIAYGIQDGMLSVECNGGQQPAGIKAQDGKFWFPNQNGVVVIDPDVVPHNLQSPLAIIEMVKVDRTNVSFKNFVQLEPGQTDLEINYTAPSSIKAEYTQFKYKLDGLDDKWTEAGTRRTINYSHLPPGRYTFKVIAANSDGLWNETGATLEVYMKPYFYQTRWFIAVCVIGGIALASSIYAGRVHQLKANEKRLTKQVFERTAELFERTEQLEVANNKLEKLASLDGLTNIANRRRFTEFLTQEWQRSQRTQTPLALLMMDVDYFKPYNDTYGHQGGDECLKRVAALLRETVHRSTDLAARYGGEEFVVVLTDTDKEGALVVAETIRAQVEALEIPHSGSKVNPYVTLSIGVAAIIPDRQMDANDLIAAADHSLYRAKENGRNRCWTEEEVWA